MASSSQVSGDPLGTLAPQLTLGVRLRDDATFENFLGGRNQATLDQLQLLLQDPSATVICLSGESGSGKSHLLQAACHRLEEQGATGLCLGLPELVLHEPGVLEGLEHYSLVCLDGVTCLQGRLDWQEAVFHLYNRLQDAGHRLLLASSCTPAELDLALPDLASRLRAALVLQLLPPRDEDRLALLITRAERRGLSLGDDVAQYILRRASRHTGDLLAILDRLDELSLQAQRRVTVPFVKSVMGW